MAEFFGCKKKPLLIFRWDRSKDHIAWSDNVVLKNQLTVSSFSYNFKIGLLDEWLSQNTLATK